MCWLKHYSDRLASIYNHMSSPRECKIIGKFNYILCLNQSLAASQEVGLSIPLSNQSLAASHGAGLKYSIISSVLTRISIRRLYDFCKLSPPIKQFKHSTGGKRFQNWTMKSMRKGQQSTILAHHFSISSSSTELHPTRCKV